MNFPVNRQRRAGCDPDSVCPELEFTQPKLHALRRAADVAVDGFAAQGREIADNPAIFPTAADTRRLQMLRDFDVRSRRLMSRQWTEIKVR